MISRLVKSTLKLFANFFQQRFAQAYYRVIIRMQRETGSHLSCPFDLNFNFSGFYDEYKVWVSGFESLSLNIDIFPSES